MSRRLLAAVAAAALTFGLAACGDGGDGTVTEPPPEVGIGSDDGGASDGGGDEAPSSDGGGAEGDPVEAAPDIPAPDPADFPGMDENTPEGAEQAFKYYWAITFWGLQTGESAQISELRTEDCGGCEESVAQINEMQKQGRFWSEVMLEDQILESEESESKAMVVNYLFLISAHSEPTADGGGRTEIPQNVYSTAGEMTWMEGVWKVDGLGVTVEPVDEG